MRAALVLILVAACSCSRSPRSEPERERARAPSEQGISVQIPKGWERVAEPGMPASVVVLRLIENKADHWPASVTFSRIGAPRTNPNRDERSCIDAAENVAQVAGPGVVRSARIKKTNHGPTCWMLLTTDRTERISAFLEHARGWWMMDCVYDGRDGWTVASVCSTVFESARPD